MKSLNYIFNEPISLTNCDREPIHIPNAIQPHGILLVLNEADWQILQVSDNTKSLLGYSPEQLLNQTLADILAPESQQNLTQCLAGDFDAVNPLHLKVLNI